jgi:hypothetical protein
MPQADIAVAVPPTCRDSRFVPVHPALSIV